MQLPVVPSIHWNSGTSCHLLFLHLFPLFDADPLPVLLLLSHSACGLSFREELLSLAKRGEETRAKK